MNAISVNFNEVKGRIKPLNGVCCAPYAAGKGKNQTFIQDFFTKGNIPYCRLHDCCGAYGGSYYVDIRNIFRNFDADENDPASYDFYYTDEYIAGIQKAGGEAYYRLGETIEWGSKKYATLMPPDFHKWARICKHIIMHYNEGWADGFHYGIEYWEIWNEPENPGSEYGPCMWSGSKEDYFELYKISSKYLKSRFPNIKIGGFGSCGFYALTRNNVKESYKGFVTYFTDFLDMVKRESCPLDFFSWHVYTVNEKELLAHAEYVRKTLDDHGFTETESHLNEWNIGDEGCGFKAKHTTQGGSFLAAVMSMLQKSGIVDMAMYYCFSAASIYNGFWDLNDRSISVSWYPFEAFGKIAKLKNYVEPVCNEEGVYAVASSLEGARRILIANYGSENSEYQIVLNSELCNKKANLWVIDEKFAGFEGSEKEVVIGEGGVTIHIPQYTVIYMEL